MILYLGLSQLFLLAHVVGRNTPPPGAGKQFFNGLHPELPTRDTEGMFIHKWSHVDHNGRNTTLHVKMNAHMHAIYLAEADDVVDVTCPTGIQSHVNLKFNSRQGLSAFWDKHREEMRRNAHSLVGHQGLTCHRELVSAGGDESGFQGMVALTKLHKRERARVDTRRNQILIPTERGGIQHAFDGGQVYFRADNLMQAMELADPSITQETNMDVHRALLGRPQWQDELYSGWNYNRLTKSAQNEKIKLASKFGLDLFCVSCFATVSGGVEVGWNLRSGYEMWQEGTVLPIKDMFMRLQGDTSANIDLLLTASQKTFTYDSGEPTELLSYPIVPYGVAFSMFGFSVNIGLDFVAAYSVRGRFELSKETGLTMGFDSSGVFSKAISMTFPEGESKTQEDSNPFAFNLHQPSLTLKGEAQLRVDIPLSLVLNLKPLGQARVVASPYIKSGFEFRESKFQSDLCGSQVFLTAQADSGVTFRGESLFELDLRVYKKRWGPDRYDFAEIGPKSLLRYCAPSSNLDDGVTPTLRVSHHPARIIAYETGNLRRSYGGLSRGVALASLPQIPQTCEVSKLEMLTPIYISDIGSTVKYSGQPSCGRVEKDYAAVVYTFKAPVSRNYRFRISGSSVPVAVELRERKTSSGMDSDGKTEPIEGCNGMWKGCGHNRNPAWSMETPTALRDVAIDVAIPADDSVVATVYILSEEYDIALASFTLIVEPVVDHLEYFVDAGIGDDSNDGSFDGSFKTISKALDELEDQWISGQHLFGRIMLWPTLWYDSGKDDPYEVVDEKGEYLQQGFRVPPSLKDQPIIVSSFSSIPAGAMFERFSELCPADSEKNCITSEPVKNSLYGTALDTAIECTRDNNRAFILERDTSFTLNGITIRFCGFADQTRAGGAIWATKGSTSITLLHSYFFFSDAKDGGAVQVSVKSSARIQGTTLHKGGALEATMRGGCLSIAEGSDVTVGDSYFVECTSSIDKGEYSNSGSGGAIAVSDSMLKMSSSYIYHASAEGNGGGIFISGSKSTVKLRDCGIGRSHANAAGGAVFVSEASNVTIRSANITECSTDQAYGASVLHAEASASIVIAGSNTSGNTAPYFTAAGGATIELLDSSIGESVSAPEEVSHSTTVEAGTEGKAKAPHHVYSTPFPKHKAATSVSQGPDVRTQRNSLRIIPVLSSTAKSPSAILVSAGQVVITRTDIAAAAPEESAALGSSQQSTVACSALASNCSSCDSCDGPKAMCTESGCDPEGLDLYCAEITGVRSKYDVETQTCLAPLSAPPEPKPEPKPSTDSGSPSTTTPSGLAIAAFALVLILTIVAGAVACAAGVIHRRRVADIHVRQRRASLDMTRPNPMFEATPTSTTGPHAQEESATGPLPVHEETSTPATETQPQGESIGYRDEV